MLFLGLLINLDSSKERLQKSSEALKERNIKYCRVAAIDGRSSRIDEFPEYNDSAARKFMGRSLLGGEIGCFLSHLTCLKSFIESKQQYAAIFEDDIIISPSAVPIIEFAIKNHKKCELISGNNWEVFSLCASRLKIYTKYMYIGEHRIVQSHYFPMRCTGLLWSREGAQSFVKEFEKIDAPYDVYLRRWVGIRDNALAVYPAVVTHADAGSDIASSIDRKRSRHDRAENYSIKRLKRVMAENVRGYKLKFGFQK